MIFTTGIYQSLQLIMFMIISLSYKNVLLDYIIPKLLPRGTQGSELIKLLTKLKAKFIFVTDKTVSGLLKAMDNSAMGHSMIVTFLFKHNLVMVERQIKFVGNYHIVRNRGDSPFRMVQYMVGRKKLVTPYFAKEWSHMLEAGLSQLWYTVY